MLDPIGLYPQNRFGGVQRKVYMAVVSAIQKNMISHTERE